MEPLSIEDESDLIAALRVTGTPEGIYRFTHPSRRIARVLRTYRSASKVDGATGLVVAAKSNPNDSTAQ